MRSWPPLTSLLLVAFFCLELRAQWSQQNTPGSAPIPLASTQQLVAPPQPIDKKLGPAEVLRTVYQSPLRVPELPAVSPQATSILLAETVTGREKAVWLSTDSWFDPDLWKMSLELGTNGATGNTDTISLKTGSEVVRETDFSKLFLKISYARTEANSAETQNFGLVDAGHDWKFGDSPWELFAKSQLAYDEFKAFDARLALNSGVGYAWLNNEVITFKSRFGAGTSREFGGPADQWIPEALFGLDYEHKLTEKQKLTAKVEYFPDWSDFASYRIVSDLGWEVMLDEVADLSLKFALIDQYDSTPSGAKPNDLNYSAVLIWKK